MIPARCCGSPATGCSSMTSRCGRAARRHAWASTTPRWLTTGGRRDPGGRGSPVVGDVGVQDRARRDRAARPAGPGADRVGQPGVRDLAAAPGFTAGARRGGAARGGPGRVRRPRPADAVRDGVVAGHYLRAARAVEAALRPVPMNIDGATAVIYAELGFAAPLARGLFVLSRSVGILAHAWEESQQGRRNKGPMPPSILPAYLGHDQASGGCRRIHVWPG